mgnify:CR=1 FL=1
MDIFITYRKAKAVVESCEDLIQLKAARRYINLWFAAHSTIAKDGKTFWITGTLRSLYESLLKHLYVKKHYLNRKK